MKWRGALRMWECGNVLMGVMHGGFVESPYWIGESFG